MAPRPSLSIGEIRTAVYLGVFDEYPRGCSDRCRERSLVLAPWLFDLLGIHVLTHAAINTFFNGLLQGPFFPW